MDNDRGQSLITKYVWVIETIYRRRKISRRYTSFVRYFGDSNVPGLAGDNCDVQFERTAQFVPHGISRNEVIERASKAKSKPQFTDDFKPKRRGRQLTYQQLSEVLREGDILCYIEKGIYDSIRTAFHEFLQYAHNIPEKTFVLCDFKEALEINKYEEQKTALQFLDWYEFNIPNVIMPFWILNNIAGWDMIGRD